MIDLIRNAYEVDGMQISFLRSFIKIVELGSYSEAARVLFVSQSALSQQIQALEKELGFPLFIRSKREKLSLTKEGEMLRQTAVKAIRELDQTIEKCRCSVQCVNIRIACDEYDIRILPVSFFDRVRAAFPNVNIAFVPAYIDFEHQLRSNQADLVVCADCYNPEDPTLEAVPIVRTRYLCVMSPSHPLAGKAKITLEELAAYPVSFSVSGYSRSYNQNVQLFQKAWPNAILAEPYVRLYNYNVSGSRNIYVTVESARSFLGDMACVELDTDWTMPLVLLYRADAPEIIRQVAKLAER